MTKKGNAVLWIIIIIIVLGGLYLAYGKKSPAPVSPEAPAAVAPAASSLSVSDQKPGKEAKVDAVVLAQNAFVVIHKAGADPDSPGAAIGLLPLKKGSYTNVMVPLQEEVKAGANLFPMLHPDLTGSGVYDAATEGTPMNGADGKPIVLKVAVKK